MLSHPRASRECDELEKLRQLLYVCEDTVIMVWKKLNSV